MDMFPLMVESLQFSVCSVADHGFSTKLISRETYDNVSESSGTNTSKARVLLSNVMQNISLNVSCLEDFIAALEAVNDCQLLVEKLRKIAI